MTCLKQIQTSLPSVKKDLNTRIRDPTNPLLSFTGESGSLCVRLIYFHFRVMTCSCSPLHWHIRSYTVISVRPKPFVLEGWLFRLRHVLFSQATLKNKQSPGNADPAPLRQLCDVLGTGGAGEEPSSAGSSHWALPGWSGRWSVHVSQEDLSTGPFQALPKASA